VKSGGTKQNSDTLRRVWVFLIPVSLFVIGCGVNPSAEDRTDIGDRWTDPGSGSAGENDDPTDTGGETIDTSDPGDQEDEDDVALTVSPFEVTRTLSPADDVTEVVSGDIKSSSAVEVFDIGAIASGDRLVIAAEAVNSLDPVVAVFDAGGDAMIVNDDRNYYGGDFNSAIDMVSRRSTKRCYVAVASSGGTGTTGGYSLAILLARGGAVPEINTQVVYLNFDGADGIVIGRRPAVEIPVFEGSLIGEEFAGETEELIEQIVARIREDYTGLDVDFVSSREENQPTEPHTTIHFGAYDPGLLGLADYVDEFNVAVSQKAIVFVDTFQAFLPLNPSVEEMANALANVGSHETGHLLGLNHSEDVRGIMDITANLRQMLASQAFRRAPFNPEVFPIGHQDAGKLLVEAVGGDLSLFKSAAAEQLSMRAAWYDEGEPISARLRVDQPFSTCLCPSCAKHRHLRDR